MALREPSCEERSEADGAAGDQDRAIGEGRVARSRRLPGRETAESGDQEGAVPERELRLARGERGRELAGRDLAAVGVEKGEAAGMLGIGGSHQARHRCRGKVGVLAVSGRERLTGGEHETRARQRIGREPGLDQLEGAAGGGVGGLRQPRLLRGLHRHEYVLGSRGTGVNGFEERREVVVALERRPSGRLRHASPDDGQPPSPPAGRPRERAPLDLEEPRVPIGADLACPPFVPGRRGGHPIALPLEGVGGQLNAPDASEEWLPVDPDPLYVRLRERPQESLPAALVAAQRPDRSPPPGRPRSSRASVRRARAGSDGVRPRSGRRCPPEPSR